MRPYMASQSVSQSVTDWQSVSEGTSIPATVAGDRGDLG